MTDDIFLKDCGIQPDIIWLIEQNDYTPEQQRYVQDLLAINRLFGGGLCVTLKK